MPDREILNIEIQNDRFIAVSETGPILASSNGTHWEEMGSVPNTEQSIILETGLVVFTRWHNGSKYVFEIFYSDDLQIFRKVYSRTSSGYGYWKVYDMDEYFLSTCIIDNQMNIFYSVDGAEWEAVFTGGGFLLPSVSITSKNEVVVESNYYEPSSPWIGSPDGRNWTWHRNHLIGPYVSIGDGYAGLFYYDLYYSTDAQNWQNMSLDLLSAGKELIKGENRIIAGNWRDIFSSTDGINWSSTLNPVPNEESEFINTHLAYFHNYFWVWKTFSYSVSKYFRSVDGISWEPAEPPEGLMNEGELMYFEREAFPENTETLPINKMELKRVTQLGVSVEIKEITVVSNRPRTAVYQTVGDEEEQRVICDWGDPDQNSRSRTEPIKLLANNGVFLCLNEWGGLGMIDVRQTFLEQPYPRLSDSPLQEDSIEIVWDSSESAETYRIFRYSSSSHSNEAEQIGETTETKWTDDSPALQKHETFKFLVTAHNSSGARSLPSISASGELWSLLPTKIKATSEWNWIEADFMEYLYFQDYAWVWTDPHKWWYLIEIKYGFWAWDSTLGWIWSQRDTHPYFYQLDGGKWLYYLEDTIDPRWFFDYNLSEWVKL